MVSKTAHKRTPKEEPSVLASPLVSIEEPVAKPTTKPAITVASAVETTQATSQPTAHHGAGYVGVIAYLVGIVVALIAAIFIELTLAPYVYIALAILGVMVGILNIRDDEIHLFLSASVAFVVTSYGMASVLAGTPIIVPFLNYLVVFTGAGAFLVSLKAIIAVSKNA
jgi:hypothetical protein